MNWDSKGICLQSVGEMVVVGGVAGTRCQRTAHRTDLMNELPRELNVQLW